jgi:hypothetical protein
MRARTRGAPGSSIGTTQSMGTRGSLFTCAQTSTTGAASHTLHSCRRSRGSTSRRRQPLRLGDSRWSLPQMLTLVRQLMVEQLVEAFTLIRSTVCRVRRGLPDRCGGTSVRAAEHSAGKEDVLRSTVRVEQHRIQVLWHAPKTPDPYRAGRAPQYRAGTLPAKCRSWARNYREHPWARSRPTPFKSEVPLFI